MPVASVNFEKSIQRKRLVYNINWETFFSYLFTYAACLLLIFACIAPIFNKHINHPPLIVAISTTIAVWMFLNMILLNAVVKFNGLGIDENRADVFAILDEHYGGMNVNTTGKLIRNVKLQRGFRWGRIITIILDDKILYLNITTLGRGNSPSPFHGLYNYLKCKRIARVIRKQQF